MFDTVSRLILVLFCLVALVGCSGQKATQKRNLSSSSSETEVISNGPDEVRKRFGEPTWVSKTKDNHIFWVYRPSYKIIPNDKGTFYVEFENDKVIKAFRIR